jgi:hypothetical protein
VTKFIASERNINKVHPSPSLHALLRGMLAFTQKQRYTLQQVLESAWFHEMSEKLNSDSELQAKTHKSLF